MLRKSFVSKIPAMLRRDGQKSRASLGWLLVVALLALPDCSFTGREPNTFRGPTPRYSAVFCDIEKPLQRHCATAKDKEVGVRLAAAAVALNTRQTSNIGLDDSQEALMRCGGEPEAVVFEGPFPEGTPVCLNCLNVIGSSYYPDANAVCVAQCEDFWGDVDSTGTLTPDAPPPPGVASFCQSHARASTNAPVNGCIDNTCTIAGILRADFDSPAHPELVDPRRIPEAVAWVDGLGVSDNGGSLTRTQATSGPPSNPPFNAGAASSQWITGGDGYVEFSASENNLSHVCGLSKVHDEGGCVHHCRDTDRGLNDIDFGISLNHDGRFYVLERGQLVTGPDVNGSFGTYEAGERFRVTVQDNSDGTASISYWKMTASCVPGSPCLGESFYFHTGDAAHYKLRVDSSFREQGATLSDVRIVRIH